MRKIGRAREGKNRQKSLGKLDQRLTLIKRDALDREWLAIRRVLSTAVHLAAPRRATSQPMRWAPAQQNLRYRRRGPVPEAPINDFEQKDVLYKYTARGREPETSRRRSTSVASHGSVSAPPTRKE